MNRAEQLLPLLGWKPHVLVVHMPAFMWVACTAAACARSAPGVPQHSLPCSELRVNSLRGAVRCGCPLLSCVFPHLPVADSAVGKARYSLSLCRYEYYAKGVMDIPAVRKFTIVTAEVSRAAATTLLC
jgi:hypothetical protein